MARLGRKAALTALWTALTASRRGGPPVGTRVAAIPRMVWAIVTGRYDGKARLVAMSLATAYIVSPIDLIPDFVPFIGPVDDALLAALVLRHFVRRAGPEVIRGHWRGDPASLDRLSRAAGVSLS